MRWLISGEREPLTTHPLNLHGGESIIGTVCEDPSSTREKSPAEASPKCCPPPLPFLPPLCILPPTPSVPPPSLPHWTACSLAVLPESWGFMTSGSSGGVEKGSILSCSNVSSERRTANGQQADDRLEAAEGQTNPKDSPLRRKAKPTVAGA